jgi:hypothetical protein
VDSPLDVKRNDYLALDFALHMSRLLSVSVSLDFRVRLMLSSTNTCLIISRVLVSLSPRFAENLTLFLCQIRREIASGQIHDSK